MIAVLRNKQCDYEPASGNLRCSFVWSNCSVNRHIYMRFIGNGKSR